MLVHLSLSQLHLSEKNVRKTHHESAYQEMCASLLHHGLQQNLVVIEASPQHYAVIAGGRRLRAMQDLYEQGKIIPNIGDEWLIPCQIAYADDATELSLVENTIRIAMHPADQYEAWRLMMEEGKSTADVAIRFGVTEQLVRQRLKLGKVSPTLMQAYRDNQTTLEALMAFTLCDDEARQLAVWEQVKGGYQISPNQIRRLLTEGSVSSHSKLAKFVGEEAYEQAGGLITRDLFQDACYFENAALLESLALSKLNTKAAELRTQWSFVDARLDVDHTVMRGYTALEASIIGAPVGMKESFEAKIARYEALENGTHKDEDADEEALQQEYEVLEAELEELKEQIQPYLDYTSQQKQLSGCFLWIHQDGSLQIQGGMQRMTSHRPISDLSEHSNTARETEGDMQGDDIVSHGIAAAGDYSQSLKDDLGIYRTQMLQAAIADDFAAAFDLMTYTLAVKHCSDMKQHYMAAPLAVSVEEFRSTTSLKDEESTISGQKLVQQRAVLSLEFLTLADHHTRFKAFCALSDIQKQAIFAYVTAKSVHGGYGHRMHPLLETMATRLQVQAHQLWRPAESNFFKRIKKPQLLTLITEVIGGNWCSKVADQTKGQIASWLGRVFAGDNSATSGIDGAALGRISEWMPDRMEYMIATDNHSFFMNDEEEADSDEAIPNHDASESEADVNDESSNCEEATAEPLLPDWMMNEVA
jgi:ParB family transcriptional regulator, chromosome partitioning protein